ncbi:hypothetical protein [Bacillus badius]|uniref:hypothetical protein n=1 Tax=Bacillus badius TaxID=1455 RepID=UPI0005978B9F|nr:hypothetical protein [Bacillus badius]KIL72568.1 hypothetical protein SD78_4153 [Bacillus badius]
MLSFIKPILPLFAVTLLLIGCSNKDTKNDIHLIASEKSLPYNFYDIAVKREEVPYFEYLVNKADNQAQYKETWDLFKLKTARPAVNFKESSVFFVGVLESGSCPYELKDSQINLDNQIMKVHLVEPDRICTDDATPRTFVIEVDKESAEKLENMIIVQSNVETTVPINNK